MSDIEALEKDLKKRKRIAIEWAGKMHDLVEERLPASYAEIPELAQQTYDACVAWDEARKALQAAKG